MTRKADLFASVAVRSGIAGLVRHALRRRLLVVTYHRIRENCPSPSFMFDDETFSCSAAQFDEQIQALVRYRRVVSLDQTIEALQGGRPLPDHATLITFDDGASDNYELAFPILRRHGATAVFFVPTSMLAGRCTGWWDTIAYLLKSAPSGKYEIQFGGLTVPVDLTGRAAVLASIKAVQTAVKSLTRFDQEDVFDRVSAATAGRMPSTAEQSSQIMTEDQLKEMAAHGQIVGGHSHTHRILAQLSEAEQRQELSQSKAILQSVLGVPVRSLAYPVGAEGHYTSRTCEIAREVGYDCAFNFRLPGGFADLSRVARYDIPRISACASGGLLFRAQVSGLDPSRIGAWRAQRAQARSAAQGAGA